MTAAKPGLFSTFVAIWRNRPLIASLARRDLLARYRGSFGDALWAVWNPLLQMATYFFVFGIVMQTRFPGIAGNTGYAFYLICGMLPWLAISEAVARSPQAMVENRHLVKKTVFPLEIISVEHVLAALVTQTIGTGLFLLAYVAFLGAPSATLAWLPVLLIPQVALTLGICWVLASLGPFVRDLTQIIGPVLMLIFFTTPICYAENSLPEALAPWMRWNPIAVIVRQWRRALLDGAGPEWGPWMAVTAFGVLLLIFGSKLFQRVRGAFADVL